MNAIVPCNYGCAWDCIYFSYDHAYAYAWDVACSCKSLQAAGCDQQGSRAQISCKQLRKGHHYSPRSAQLPSAMQQLPALEDLLHTMIKITSSKLTVTCMIYQEDYWADVVHSFELLLVAQCLLSNKALSSSAFARSDLEDTMRARASDSCEKWQCFQASHCITPLAGILRLAVSHICGRAASLNRLRHGVEAPF